MIEPAPNHYEILGVSENATQSDIVSAFDALKREHGPKPNFNASLSFNPQKLDQNELFILIQEAFDTLTDVEKRKGYDSFLAEKRSFPKISYPIRPWRYFFAAAIGVGVGGFAILLIISVLKHQ